MTLIDHEGRLFGRINLFDAAVAGFLLLLIPIAYGTFLLFRAPSPRITSVLRVPITQEERRVAGGNRLTAKLKVRGSGLRPMLQASVDGTRALGFVFENPNSADVLVGPVPPGPHDLILFDGVQEVARLPKSVTIESAPSTRISAVGTLVHMEKQVADGLSPAATAVGAPYAILAIGETRDEPGGRWQRAAEILLQCDPDPGDDGCTVGGVPITVPPFPTVQITGASGTAIAFALTELLPASPPAAAIARLRLGAAPEILRMVRAGDRDDSLDARAAVVVDVTKGPTSAELDVTVKLGIDASPEGWRYRGRPIKAGAPFTLTTDRYVAGGTVLTVSTTPAAGSK